MTSTHPVPPTAAVGRETRRGRRIRAVGAVALVASAALAGLGIAWLAAPGLNPFDRADGASILSALAGGHVTAIVAIAVGVPGAALAGALVRRADRTGVDRIGTWAAGAAVLALVSCAAFGSTGVIAYAGYLFGFAAVAAGVATIVVTLVRAPRLGLALFAGLLAVLAAAVWSAGLTLDGVLRFVGGFGGALATEIPDLAVAAVVVIATASWAVLAILGAGRTRGGRAFEAGLVRHRIPITVLAALGPLPYAVARATWLTPWPVFGPDADELEPMILATGLVLGSGAVAASILTLGLILPWGETFPRWIPRAGGRRVPVAFAAVPGFTVAGLLCLAAAPAAVNFATDSDGLGGLVGNLVLPFWFWGPALLLAVWAYVARRSGEERD